MKKVKLRTVERDSIRQFIENAGREGMLAGRVLDYGCGKQPYREVVESFGGRYYGFDRTDYPGSCVTEDMGVPDYADVGWDYDTVICTQVIQYVWPEELRHFMNGLRLNLRKKGVLLMTGPTNWPVVEQDDLWRVTRTMAESLFQPSQWQDVRVEDRAFVEFQHERWSLGWQATAVRV